MHKYLPLRSSRGREVEGGAKQYNLPLLCLCAAEVRPLVGPLPMKERRISLNIQKYPQCVLLSIAFVHILLFLGISPPSSTRLRAGSPPRWFDLRSSWRTSRDNARYLHIHQVHVIPLKYPELRASSDGDGDGGGAMAEWRHRPTPGPARTPWCLAPPCIT